MLCLSRKVNDSVMLRLEGIEVKVTVIGIDGNKVRLGFDAPQEVSILRAELVSDGQVWRDRK